MCYEYPPFAVGFVVVGVVRSFKNHRNMAVIFVAVVGLP